MQTVRVFVSSPSDAQFERMRVDRTVERLNGEFADVARLEVVRWEREFYKAHSTFQSQIPEAADCDIVVAILRHRLGTEMPSDFPRMSNGDPFPSGTAYEVLSAIETSQSKGVPDVYVFRYPEPPMIRLDDPETSALVTHQWERLKTFFAKWFVTPEGHFRAAFHEFSTTDDFEDQLEKLLRSWLEEKVLKGRSVAWPIAVNGSPFRGLSAFGPKHASVFFGRSRDTTKAVDTLKDAAKRGSPFLLLVGASGVGKSSMALAGLVPRIATPGVVPDIDVWRVTIMRPSNAPGKPTDALAKQLFFGHEDSPLDADASITALSELKHSDYDTPDQLAAVLAHADETSTKPIVRALDEVASAEQQRGGYERAVQSCLLLVVDQLDELFGADVSEEERQRFSGLLKALVMTKRVWVIVTLRANLYEHFLRQSPLLALKTNGATYDLDAPHTASLVEIVRGPAEAAGIVYELNEESGERLDERLLMDADRPDMLPLLQFTLDQLFERRESAGGETRLTFEAYESFGRIAGAIDRAGETALQGLGSAELNSLPKFMRGLVGEGYQSGVLGRGGLTLRSLPLAEIDADPPLRRLTDALAAARLVIVEKEGASGTVRLIHQRVIESWKRASETVKANADFYRILDDVGAQLRRWIASNGHSSTLLPRGRPLGEARDLRARYGNELAQEYRHFIMASQFRHTYFFFYKCIFLAFLVLLMFIGYLSQFEPEADKTYFNTVSWFVFLVLWPSGACFLYWRFRHRTSLLILATRQMESGNGREVAGGPLVMRLSAITTNAAFNTAFAVACAILLTRSESLKPYIWPTNSGATGILASIFLWVTFYWVASAIVLNSRLRGSLIEKDSLGESLFPKLSAIRCLPFLALPILAFASAFISELGSPFGNSGYLIADYKEFWTNLAFQPGFYVPSVAFGVVLTIAEAFWGRRGTWVLLPIIPSILVGWISAYTIARGVYIEFSASSWALLCGGFFGGAAGAVSTALTIPALREWKPMAFTAAIGAVCGLLLPTIQTQGSIYVYLSWQVSIAVFLGYRLSGRPAEDPDSQVSGVSPLREGVEPERNVNAIAQ